jgi:hypothetical protein
MKEREWDCVVLHDVDLVPHPGVPYTECDSPIQLGSELEHFNWGVPYHAIAFVSETNPISKTKSQ